MAFTDPIATSAPPFTVKGTAHSISPHTYFNYTGSKLLPTNVWWQNLLITHIDSGNYNGKSATFPYAQWPASNSKGVTTTYFGDQPGDRDVNTNSITLSGAKDISLTTNEAVTSREITDYSDLGVRLRFNTSGGNMVVNLVQGMAFNSGIFTAATPVITIEGAILEINGGSPGSANLTGVTKLKVKTNRYDREWLIYASSSLSFTLSGQSLVATAAFTGSIQIALLGNSADETAYDNASTSVLTGGSVGSTFSGDTATMTFTFTSSGSGAPLVFALPHHQDLMPGASYTNIQLSSLKGNMKALRASTWTLTEALTTINWSAPNAIPGSATSDIQTAINTEKNSTHDAVGNGWGMSPYYGGKYAAKMARMILIAEEIGDSSAATSIATALKTFIATYLTATPTGSAGVMGSGYKNAFLYQGGSTWKGVSTENGLADMGADFGSGRFNDHHFHYGYWIYAAAVVARNDASWRATHKAAIESLIRDIANPSYSDTYFPKFRHKDWFAGHSWAGGLVGIDVGPGQESTSEAINAWYGIHLWGLATSNTELSNMGRLLLASEIRSAKRYWHIAASSDIYPSPFNNHATAVIIRTHKVAVETYFGSRPHYFYGIQSLPFTPITQEYMDSTWVTRAYPKASVEIPVSPTGNPQDTGWNSVIYGMHAVIDPSAGYSEAQSLTIEQITAPGYDSFVQYGASIDNGHSKANALYWASTRTSGGGTVTTTTSLAASPAGSATTGATVTLTATISPSGATGTVTFKDGATTIGSGSVSSGVASTTTSSLSLGAHTLTAEFASSNTGAYSNSTSNGVSYTISASGGGGSTTNASAVPFMALASGQPNTAVRTTVANANYTLAANDTIVAYTSISAARTVTLPTASSVQIGKQFIIKDESGSCSGGNTITITGTIDGGTNYVLNAAYAKAVLYSNGTNWFRIAS
ncbi:MAG: glycosyl hydrolase [Candidatus Saccharimonadales bacterium]